MTSRGNFLPWYFRPLARAWIESRDGGATVYLCIAPRLVGRLFRVRPRVYSLTEKPATVSS